MGMASITAGHLNNFDMTVQIDSNKVTWDACLLVVSYPCIRLEGTRTSIVEIIQCRSKPAEYYARYCPEHKCKQHPDSEEEQRMGMLQGSSLEQPCSWL